MFFDSGAKDLINSGVRFLPLEEAVKVRDRVIAVPFDIPPSDNKDNPYNVVFNDTELTLWNRIVQPSTGSWKAIPNESTPLWYQNVNGTLIPAWNLFGNLFQLLTFGEERGSARKDAHGRFVAEFSPRAESNLLEIPAFNEAVAALVAACAGLEENGQPSYTIGGLLKPPAIVLSHDCDILLGNDLWTQSVRAARIFLPLLKLRPPKVGNAWWNIRNAITPRRFYFDNVTGMIDLERCFGHNSTFYLLNGSGGRFGARSGFDIIPELLKKIPPEWDLGIHYNYDTFLDEERFKTQIEQLQEVIDSPVTVGRAHYMMFDPDKSFLFLQKYGVSIDESSGYPDRIGYRNGIAGCFQVFDSTSASTLDMWEIPMTVMDSTLVRQYGDASIDKMSELLRHLKCVGGALSILFHPGLFFNPEHKQMLSVYHKILIECRQLGAISRTARALVDEIR